MAENELATTDRAGPMARIERLIENGKLEPAQLRELLDVQREWRKDAAREAYNRDMAAAQADMPTVVRDASNNHTNSRYAKYETVQAKCKAIWVRHGFALNFAEEPSERENWLRVVCEVRHVEGHVEKYAREAPVDNLGPKGNPVKTMLHGCQSTVSYLARNLTCSVFGIVVADQDIDGNAAVAPAETITEEEAIKLGEWMDSLDLPHERLLKFYGIERLTDLPRGKLAHAQAKLQKNEDERKRH